MAEFSENQIGKRVVAQDGSAVDEVTAVRNGSMPVTVGEDADGDVIGSLGWDGASRPGDPRTERPVPLERRRVRDPTASLRAHHCQ